MRNFITGTSFIIQHLREERMIENEYQMKDWKNFLSKHISESFDPLCESHESFSSESVSREFPS